MLARILGPGAAFATVALETGAGGEDNAPSSMGRAGGKGARSPRLMSGCTIAALALFGSEIATGGAGRSGLRSIPAEMSCPTETGLRLDGPSEGASRGCDTISDPGAVKGRVITQAPAIAIKTRAAAAGTAREKSCRNKRTWSSETFIGAPFVKAAIDVINSTTRAAHLEGMLTVLHNAR